jgi:beta-lactamase class C
MRSILHGAALVALWLCVLLPTRGHAATTGEVVADAVHPVMQRYGIPGMAVGVVVAGRRQVFDFGLASKATGKPVTDATLFEIGSLSKTFTATLAADAQLDGRLALSDSVSQYLPSLRGSGFGKVSLLELGTHMAGGLPLQVPDEITNNDRLMAYLRAWQPTYAPGTVRVYSNVSIGMLGVITAKSLHGDFAALMRTRVFSGLGLEHTYLDVPKAQLENYAQGYTKADAPIRMAPGVLASEAYGIRTTAGDLLRFVAANMGMFAINETLQRAMTDTHTGYFRVGAMTQDLIWEQYQYPVGLSDLLAGNSTKMGSEANPATRLDPPLAPRDDVLINKTGSTNGFAAYVAFVPEKKIGIVLLANKNYPIDARVTATYEILTRLADSAPKD